MFFLSLPPGCCLQLPQPAGDSARDRHLPAKLNSQWACSFPLTSKLFSLAACDTDFALPRESHSWPICPPLCQGPGQPDRPRLPLIVPLRSHGLCQLPEASCGGNEGQLCWRKVTYVTSWAQQSSREGAGSLGAPAGLPIGLEESQVPRQRAGAEAQLWPLKALLCLSQMTFHVIVPRVFWRRSHRGALGMLRAPAGLSFLSGRQEG